MLEGEGIFLFKNQNQCLYGRIRPQNEQLLVINMVYVPEDIRARGMLRK